MVKVALSQINEFAFVKLCILKKLPKHFQDFYYVATGFPLHDDLGGYS